MHGTFISPNSLLIECIINPTSGVTQQKNPFGTQQQLQNRKIIGIETFSNQDCDFSPISTSNPVLSPLLMKGAYLSLYTASLTTRDAAGKVLRNRPEGLYYDQIPLTRLRTMVNADTASNNVTSGSRDIFRMEPTEVSWAGKSFVAFPNAKTITQPVSALFLVHYLDLGDPGLNWM